MPSNEAVFIVRTPDRRLARALLEARWEGVSIEESLNKSLGAPSEITLWVEAGTAVLAFATALFLFIQKARNPVGKPEDRKPERRDREPERPQVCVYSRKFSAQLRVHARLYEHEVEITIHEDEYRREG